MQSVGNEKGRQRASLSFLRSGGISGNKRTAVEHEKFSQAPVRDRERLRATFYRHSAPRTTLSGTRSNSVSGTGRSPLLRRRRDIERLPRPSG